MNEKLPARTKVLYGMGDLGIAMLTASVQFFLLYFLTDIVLVDAALAGTALLVGKLTWDAVNDPLIGWLSDRTRSRWGRRRPYLLFGALPLGLTTWLLYSIPSGLGGAEAFLVVLFSYLLFDTMHTLVSTAYSALSPELTYDYEERTALITVRMVFTVVGYILGAAATTPIAAVMRGLLGSEKAGYSGMGAVFGLIALTAVLVTAVGVKEPMRPESRPSTIPPLRSVLLTFKNRPFMQLMAAQFLSSFSFTLLTSLLPFFVIYQVDMEAQIPFLMLTMLVAIGIFLFPWKAVSQRINKGPSYALGLLIAALAVISSFFLSHRPSP
ncbi:MAG TPA: MFS transporter, partial [Anaerolineae bacterium]|nr:MFS transporter [Anaerolineae bacterium]